MKKIILVFGLFVCISMSVLGQETPIKLIEETRAFVKDSAESVQNPKAIVQEAKALIQNLKDLEKADKKADRKSEKEGKSYKLQLGLTLQPFNFQNYGDENKSGGARLVKADGFNGFAVGVMLRKPFSKHFSLKSELTYAQQNEKYEFSTTFFGSIGGDTTFLYNGKANIDYTFFKIPILADYSLNLDSKKTWLLHAQAGIQISYLKTYKASHKIYFTSFDNGVAQIEDAVREEFTDDSGTVYRSTWDKISGVPVYINTRTLWEDKPVFKTTSLGFVFGFELEKRLGETFLIGLGGRYEQNFSNSEQKNRSIFTRKDKSTQKRFAMTISFSHLILSN